MSAPAAPRYPGPRYFEDRDIDRLLFFGRRRDAESLLHMLLTEKVVVLYAKSGMGKTSLLNAGLSERLRGKGYLPFRVTFTNPDESPLEAVYGRIEEAAAKRRIDHRAGRKETLWEYFKSAEFWSEQDTLLTPVLVLDQFEELFSLHSFEARKAFTSQLADLLQNRVPMELLNSVGEDGHLPYSDAPPSVKIIVSIREDFLGQLEEMAEEIPGILQNRFRLRPMSREQARDAIVEPAKVEAGQLASETFTYDAGSIDGMLNFLCLQKTRGEEVMTDEVEPFQLQLLCRYIEESLGHGHARVVGPNVLRGKERSVEDGLRRILEDYYHRQIERLSQHVRKKVYRLFEKELISATDRRLSVEEGEIQRRGGVSADVLRELVDLRLLRSEPRLGSVYYELSHDTLIPPVRMQQKVRREARQRRVVIPGWCAVAFLLLAFSLLAFKYTQTRKADRRLRLARGTVAIGDSIADRQHRLLLAFQSASIALSTGRTPFKIENSLRESFLDLTWVRPGGIRSDPAAPLGNLALSPDGTRLASRDSQGTVLVRGLNAQEETSEPLLLHGAEGRGDALAFSPDGTRLASGGADGAVLVWEVNEHEKAAEPKPLLGLEANVNVLAFNPDGTRLASGDTNGMVGVLDLTGREKDPKLLSGHETWVYALAFSPDGKRLASGDASGKVLIWDVTGGEETPQRLPAHGTWVSALVFSPDGARLASGDASGMIRVWNAAEPGKEPTMLRGHKGPVKALVFSPDSHWLVSGSTDKTARVWNAAEPGNEPAFLQHDSPITALAFPDGARLLTGYRALYENSVGTLQWNTRYLNMTLQELITEACTVPDMRDPGKLLGEFSETVSKVVRDYMSEKDWRYYEKLARSACEAKTKR